jgi:hypothetical protein
MEVALENEPGNQSLLDKYIETLENYIKSNLLEEHLLRNLRIVYSKAIDKKIEGHYPINDVNTLVKKIRNSVSLGEYDLAFQVSDLLIKNCPEHEASWIESIRACVESKDNIRLKEVATKMQKQKINWTKEGKESVRLWIMEFANET